MSVVCPTPWKLRYVSRREAHDAMRHKTQPLRAGQMHAYPCVCGVWHLTSMTKKQAKTLKKRARAMRAA
jgi:hypothetical protein